jgi:hypothetical protein
MPGSLAIAPVNSIANIAIVPSVIPVSDYNHADEAIW